MNNFQLCLLAGLIVSAPHMSVTTSNQFSWLMLALAIAFFFLGKKK